MGDFVQLCRQGFAVAQRVDPQTRQSRTVFYESTGLRGHSTLREIDIASGKVLRKISLEDELFGLYPFLDSCGAVVNICAQISHS